ncbi:MAG: hypothetical protein OEZ01_18460, partial [Candidatus Heimdallarchaeota archaeon]|nr:hypothetical protein [Candidatus Heimdallarchaeota archaeon]
EIIVVGKIKLDPVLDKIEQNLSKNLGFPFNLFETSEALHRNKIYISINNQPIDINSKEAMWHKSVTSVNLEQTFFIRVKKPKTLYYSGGLVKTELPESLSNKLIFPGGVKFVIQPSDKAVYIGTFEYYRDYNEVEKVTLQNEYNEAKNSFVNKFGNKITLRQVKALKI